MDHGPLKAPAGIQDPPYGDPDKQGAVNLLCDQRQSDGYHRRHQRPEGRKQGGDVLCGLPLCPKGRHGKGHEEHGRQSQYSQAFRFRTLHFSYFLS